MFLYPDLSINLNGYFKFTDHPTFSCLTTTLPIIFIFVYCKTMSMDYLTLT